ncbi:carbohydrate binding domain-containing protein [Cohnella sp. JJ-181]|uniref:carbohydrate binding domain-containing protein n=1 Tax=Cohnella rhizoplanae TaxID=2974897 RepID=UPI0022FF7A69|nr:carbohydrate binding domain-containing protein [Cohnella sp. JJ-181]CAI6043728.1 hypothetical protein COHCIP112018_01191 [Cohnella sp. JJ-181]
MDKTVFRHKFPLLFLTLALAIGLLPQSLAGRAAQAANWPYGEEGVANGNFETTPSGFPTDWTLKMPNTASYISVDTALKTSGLQGLKLTDTAGGTREVGVVSNPVPIVYGASYTAEVKANVTTGTVYLKVQTKDASGNLGSESYMSASTSITGWQTLSVTFTPPQAFSSTAIVSVYESSSPASALATIDEATLRHTGNLAANGGFELDPGTPNGFPAGWVPFAANGAPSSVTTETGTANVSAGARSVKIVDNSGTVGTIGMKTPPIPIRPGETFDIQVKVKVDAGTVAVLARSFDGSGAQYGQIPGVTRSAAAGWQTVSFSYTPQAPYTSTLVLMIYGRDENAATTAYIDEVSVTSSELLFNPSFESGTGALPDGWIPTGTPANGVSWVTAPNPVDHGSKAVKLADSDNANLQLQSALVKHKLGSTYTASIKANVTSGKVKLALQSLNWGGAVLTDYSAAVQSTAGVSGWQTLKISVSPPNWASSVRVVLSTDSSAADTAVLDSAELRFGWPADSLNEPSMPFRPADRSSVEQNPPDFSWRYVEGADQYELQISTSDSFTTTVYAKAGIPVNVFNLPSTLTAGAGYYWRVRYHLPQGWSAWSDTRQFGIKADAVPFTVPDIDTMLNGIPSSRPRILTTANTLNAFKQLKNNVGAPIYAFAQTRVDGMIAAQTGTPGNPASNSDVFGITYGETTTILSGALMYLITEDPDYLNFTKTRLMNIIEWNPDGTTSYQNDDRSFREIVLAAAVAYDWLNVTNSSAFSTSDRQKLLAAIHTRTQTLYNDILDVSSLYKQPYNSHGGTAAGYVAIIATAMMHETGTVNGIAMHEYAKAWFKNSVPVRINWYPPVGGEQGGWASGTGYWEASHLADKRVADVLLAATGVNLYNKAFSRNEQYLVPYFLPVGSPSNRFGDSAEKPMMRETVNLLRRQAQIYGNPSAQWAAAAAPVALDPYKLFTYPYGDDNVAKRPPFELPSARWLKDVGWVAMHSSLYDPNRISLYFKSSVYGSYNHSHADQNSFTIDAFGEKLAIDAGYYDAYGSSFHNNYYRTTLAHNAITYDGNKGQKTNDIRASGRIAGFASIGAFDGTVGDATNAYNQDSSLSGLDLARRGIIYVKPNAFVVIDKLDAKGTSSVPFEYLLHGDGSLTVDGNSQGATIEKTLAAMKVQMIYPTASSAAVTSDFKTASGTTIAPNLNPQPPSQRHAKFTFPSAAAQTIISTYQPYLKSSSPPAITSQNHTTYQSLAFSDGTMVYVRLTGSGLITVNANFKFDGTAAVVRGDNVMLLDGVRLEKDGVVLLQSNVPATVAASVSEISISGDAPELEVQFANAANHLYDEKYAEVASGGNADANMIAKGVHWTKTGNVLTIRSESGRRFKLNAATVPGPKPSVTLTVKLNGTVIGTHALAAHGTYAGGTASYGQLTSVPAGTYNVVSAPAGLIFENGGAATGPKTFAGPPWVIVDGAGGTLELTS